MNNFTLNIEYEVCGINYTCNNFKNQHYGINYFENENSIKFNIITVIPCLLKKVELIYSMDYNVNERFFSNGYQAWSFSSEYTKKDKEKGLTPLAKIHPALKALIQISGDYSFYKYPKKCGIFHSYTYCYTRIEDNVCLYGSINEKTGFTIFKCNMNENLFIIQKDIEGVTASGEYEIFNIVKFKGDYDYVFKNYFTAFGIKKLKINNMCGYTSWYNYFQKIDEKIILRDLEGLMKIKNYANIFQIDDGYEPYVGDWLEKNSKFPNGMGYISEKIHENGFMAGLWLAPFNVQRKSKLLKEHPDWLILDNETKKPFIAVAAWGGAYTLDIYNINAREYIKKVFKTVIHDWKYDMVKLDFLYSQCMQPRNNKSRGQIMCEAMEFLRECVEDKLILGCGVPLGAAFLNVDACRTGCDVNLTYKNKFYNTIHLNNEIISTKNSINNTIFRRHLNGNAFCNDPDVFFLRNNNLKFNSMQKNLLAKINNMFGGVLFVSDNILDYHDEQLDLLKKYFVKKDIKIISAEYIKKHIIKIIYIENNQEMNLTFNLKKGCIQ